MSMGGAGGAGRARGWDPAWFDDSITELGMAAWRGVEAQHVVSTMRLVDTLAEQAELERILERSKPALPEERGAAGPGQTGQAVPRHFLLSTPFRYRPRHASRFRKAGTLGLWYGAASLRTACAEVAYWRWRFLMDCAALAQQALHTEHTFFQAQVHGRAIDLSSLPWSANGPAWVHPNDYSATHEVAAAARDRRVQWIRYESARVGTDDGHEDVPEDLRDGPPGSGLRSNLHSNPRSNLCAAVLDVESLSVASPMPQQTWHCKTTRSAVMMVRGVSTVSGEDRFSWEFPGAAL